MAAKPTVAIIGAGQIGQAMWYCVADYGWTPKVYARTRPEWLDQKWEGDFVPYIAGEDPAPHGEVIVDTIAFDAEDVARYDPDMVGRLIAISSASVYRDAKGRTLDEAAQNGFPEFSKPITEDQPIVAPGPETYSTRKVRMEQKAVGMFGKRATILRPCAIYGDWSRHPREWWFAKRMLDGREVIPLAFGGESCFQTTDVYTIGDFAVGAVDENTGGIFNLADDPAPSVLEIGRAIAKHLGAGPQFHLIEGESIGNVGRTPWSVPRPFRVDNTKSMRTGHPARITYSVEVETAVHWLRDLNPADWRTAFPTLAGYPFDLFDYEAEDRFLSKR